MEMSIFAALIKCFHILKIDATRKTLRASDRVQFHRDEMQRAWNDEAETVPDVAAATFALDCGEGLCVGQHQIHWKRSGWIGRELGVSLPKKHREVSAFLICGRNPSLSSCGCHRGVVWIENFLSEMIDSTTRCVLLKRSILCVAPSAGRVMIRSSIPANLGIVPAFAGVANV